MTIAELHKKLQAIGVHPDNYYLHGLFGSSSDEEKPALSISRGKYFIEYEVYTMSRGQKSSSITFAEESRACDYIFKMIRDEWIYKQIQNIENIKELSIEKRLDASNLKEEFESCKVNNKTRAKQILRLLEVKESEINKLIH